MAKRLQIDQAFIERWSALYDYPGETELMAEVGPPVRTRGEFTKDELLRVGTWKSTRSRSYLRRNSDEMVAAVTRTALAAPELIKHRVLTILSGVGVPMASALLTIWNPEEFTVIDVRAIECLRAAGLVEREGEWPPYVRYLELCRRLAADNGTDLRTLDRAMWKWSQKGGVLPEG